VNERLMPRLQDADFLAEMVGKDSPTEKEPPTDPELTREIEIKADDFPGGMSAMISTGMAGADSQGKAVEKLAQVLGWPVYLESFTSTMPLSAFIKPGKQPVYKVLVAMEKAGYKWEHGEGTLRVRPTDWATKRSYAVPESYMAFYRDRLEKEGQLNIDDVSAIASSLTDAQLDNTFVADPDFMFLGSALSGRQGTGSRNLLRFYALLTPDQKEAIAVEPGLAFGQLTDAQWAYVGEFVSDRFGGVYVTDGSIFLKPQNETETSIGSQSRAFEITVQVQDEKEARNTTQALYMPGKKQIADMRESRKKMEEQMKAAQQKEAGRTAQPDKPAEAPQPAPAK
jgi:hypothetical protein